MITAVHIDHFKSPRVYKAKVRPRKYPEDEYEPRLMRATRRYFELLEAGASADERIAALREGRPSR